MVIDLIFCGTEERALNSSMNGDLPEKVPQAARWYRGHGWLPIPVPFKSKQPVIEAWPQLRPSEGDLPGLFPDGQQSNLGILLGEPSGGLVDSDLDCMEAVRAAPYLLPATGRISGRHSRPRSHYWYVTDDPPQKATEKFLDLDQSDLLELRSTGGQTIVAPSTHQSGEKVEWYVTGTPAVVPIRELKAAVARLAAATILARHWPAKGSRHDARLALSGALTRAGWNAETVGNFVMAVTVAAQNDGVRDAERVAEDSAERQAENGRTWGWTKLAELLGSQGAAVVQRVKGWLGLLPLGGTLFKKTAVCHLAPYQPFPVECLPAPLAAYVRESALALGCDPAYLALPVLSAVASAIGNTHTLRLKRGWDEPAIVWSSIIGDSGSLKSPAFAKAVQHLQALQRQFLDGYRAEVERYQEELARYKADKRKADKDGLEAGEPPTPPTLRRVICADTTIEKLAEILADNPRGTLVARDELAGWLGSFTRYKGKQGGTDLPNWLEMFRAGTVINDRKTGDRPTLFVSRAAVSVTGTIQPRVLARALTDDFLDAGLGARLLMAMPPKRAKRWSEVEVDPATERAYHDVLDRLLALTFDASGAEPVPHVLRLSPEAKAAWVRFYNVWGGEQAAVDGELAAAFSKLEAYAARLALVHHVVTHVYLEVDVRWPVGDKSVEAGAALVRWFAAEARRIYTTLAESTEEREARRLFEFIAARGGRVSVRELMRSNNRRYPTSADAEKAIGVLVEAELARWLPDEVNKVAELCMTRDTHDTPGDDGPDDDDDGGSAVHDTAPTPEPPGAGGQPTCGTEQDVDQAVVANGEDGSGEGVTRVMRHAEPGNGADAVGREGGVAQAGAGAIARGVMHLQALSYRMVDDPAELTTIAAAIEESATVGLDTETTGLDPRRDRVRLLTLTVDVEDGRFTYLIDCFAVDPTPLWEALAQADLVIHNAAFDLPFLAKLGFVPQSAVHDTMLLAQMLVAGTNTSCKLQDVVQRELSLTLEKAEQRSDWTATLTPDQLRYAALDADVLVPLYQTLLAKVTAAKLTDVATVESHCQPGLLWLGQAGVGFDRGRWQKLAAEARHEADDLLQQLHAQAPQRTDELFDTTWNWDSPAQVHQAFAALNIALESTDDDSLAKVSHPLADLLRRYRAAGKRCSTYGSDFLQHIDDDGRLRCSWKQMGARTGRMSSRSPNLQNLPRGEYRRCFVVPPGRVLIKADYSQVELRIAAKVANETRMIAAYQRGDDLHTLTAQQLTGKTEITKQDRQLAKPINFGLIYGLGAKSLRTKAQAEYGVTLTAAEAERYRAAFFKAWPEIAKWHGTLKTQVRRGVTETRTLAGRRVLVEPTFWYGGRANYIVQGTGGDGIKAAVGLLWERRREVSDAFPVLVVHDEIVVECDEGQAGLATAWLKKAMVDALAPVLDPVPVEVEVSVGQTWGG